MAFFLDEFAQLGYMPQIEGAISLMRGYGVSFLLYVQDLSQLKSAYGKWQSFLANSAKVFLGVSDIDTAKYVSQSFGGANHSATKRVRFVQGWHIQRQRGLKFSQKVALNVLLVTLGSMLFLLFLYILYILPPGSSNKINMLSSAIEAKNPPN